MEAEQIAVEELKLTQATIHKQDDLRFKILGWCVLFFTGLTFAFMSNDMPVDAGIYAALGLVGILAFGMIDVIHKVAQDRAVRRFQCIEKNLRDIAGYDGPCLGKVLAEEVDWPALQRGLANWRVRGPYLALLVCLLIVSVNGPSNDDKGDTGVANRAGDGSSELGLPVPSQNTIDSAAPDAGPVTDPAADAADQRELGNDK